MCVCLSPICSLAAKSGETIRVGWYESPFNITDQFGRGSGYAYDYQQKTKAKRLIKPFSNNLAVCQLSGLTGV